jgi:predicted negative regulator of RcsB-dependent stress response
MIGYETEEQQVQAIKQFWKDNGIAIIAGAVIGLGGLLGWNWYNESVVSSKENASIAFQDSVEKFVESEDVGELNRFLEDNSTTGYAPLAAMIIAQEAVLDEKFEEAKQALEKAISGDPVIADVARLRLANLHLQLQENDQAITVLEGVKSVSFSDQVGELKGDALSAKGDFDGARVAYQAALDDAVGNQNLKMKLDNIAFAKTQSMQAAAPVTTDTTEVSNDSE